MHGSSSNTVELLAHCSTAKPPRLNDRGGPALSPRRGNRRWLQFATIVVIVTIAGVLTTGGTQEGSGKEQQIWKGGPAAGAAASVVAPLTAGSRYACKRTLWLTGLQAQTADGSEAHYITSSSSYLRYYGAALRSARQNAPSLLPVLVALNAMPPEFISWAEAQGAMVVRHNVSFEARMLAASGHSDAAGERRGALQSNLMASFARLDVPAIMEKVLAQLPDYQRQGEQRAASEQEGSAAAWAAAAAAVSDDVDTEHVLWTDPDVLFREDISSCSLPSPQLLSIGPELRPGTIINCGVMYYNVRAWAATLPAMLSYADDEGWRVSHDQELLLNFFNSPAAARWRQPWHQLTALPDAYNYKVYWGEPQPGWLGLFPSQKTKAVIVHTHGPKPEMAVCVTDFLAAHVLKRDGWAPRHILHRRDEVVLACDIKVAMYLDEVLMIMAGAFKADGGGMYRWALREQEVLCPGACWLRAGTAGAGAAGSTHSRLGASVEGDDAGER